MDKELMKHLPVIRSILDQAQNRIEDMTNIKMSVKAYRIDHDKNDKGNKLINKCCMIWGTDLEYIKEKVRNTERVIMRKIICMLLKNNTELSLKEIAKRVGYRDHSMCLDALRTGSDLLLVNDEIFLKYYEPVKHLFLEEVE